MHLLLLRDKRPGHFNQVEGLALCIARLTDVEVRRIEVRRQRFASRWVRSFVTKRFRHAPGYWLTRLYGIDPAAVGAPDVVIGSGDSTIAAGILISRLTGAKFILSGLPKDHDRHSIALMLAPSPLMAGDPKCRFTPIPCKVDPDRLPSRKPIRTEADLAGARLSLLVGGRASGYEYREMEWESLARLVLQTRQRYDLRWSVSNSLRTPEFASRLFEQLALDGQLERFIDFHKSGPGSADDLFAADAIIVTEDSRSMMAEAMAARRPVIAMRPESVAFGLGTERVAATAAGGGLAVLPIATATPEQFARILTSLPISPQDPRDLIAAAIAPTLHLELVAGMKTRAAQDHQRRSVLCRADS
ncbi:MAG: mitochondrial fission ELM1 family protein [Rhizobiales bacterium]|nr:mitochondrial fission ELM1 family protein [Hyphomicrobiales bacterium]